MNGPALKIHAGFTGHSALQLLVWQVVAPAVLDEHGAGLDKAEGHVGIHTFLPERFDPIKIAGAGTIVVFAAADDLLDLPGGRHSRTRCGRLVSRKNTTSLRWRMMSHASTRHGSASSKKKSEVMQTRICSPLWIL